MPLSQALAGGVGVSTSAYTFLQNIASKTSNYGGAGKRKKEDKNNLMTTIWIVAHNSGN